MVSTYYPTGDKAAQARACRAAGIAPARHRHVETPKMVPGIVTVVCESCGCTFAVAIGDRSRCTFCGAPPSTIRVPIEDWHSPKAWVDPTDE